MLPLGLVEVSRTGVVAIARGPEGMLMYDSSPAELVWGPSPAGDRQARGK